VLFHKNIIFCSYVSPLPHLTSCTPTKSNLYLANSLAAGWKWTLPIQAPNIPCTESHIPFPFFRSCQNISPGSRHICMFSDYTSFYGGTSPNPQAWSHLLGCPRLLIQYIRSYPPYWRPFFHPQPEDAPCRCDKGPLTMEWYEHGNEL
jgi:hypothetical protein